MLDNDFTDFQQTNQISLHHTIIYEKHENQVQFGNGCDICYPVHLRYHHVFLKNNQKNEHGKTFESYASFYHHNKLS
jgi:hypothetical protein